MEENRSPDSIKSKNDHIAELRIRAHNINVFAGKADDSIRKMAKMSTAIRVISHDMTVGVGSTLSSELRGIGIKNDCEQMIERLNAIIDEYKIISDILDEHIDSTKEYNINHHN